LRILIAYFRFFIAYFSLGYRNEAMQHFGRRVLSTVRPGAFHPVAGTIQVAWSTSQSSRHIKITHDLHAHAWASVFQTRALLGIWSSAASEHPYDHALGYHPGVIPLDLRLGLTKPSLPAGDRPLRWGILACGKVAHDFTQALKMVAAPLGHAVAACATRSDPERARAFAALHGIPKAHGSYEALAADPNVDIVYVASLHPDHRRHCELALHAGKHVLVEKPIAMSAKDAAAIYALGREKGLFVGEGMWTRFFPAVEASREALRDDGPGALGPCKVHGARC